MEFKIETVKGRYTVSIIHPGIEEWDGAFVPAPANYELCDKCAEMLERFLQEDEDEEG